MYTSLDRVDIVTKDKDNGRADYVQTDHRSAAEVEAEPELSVLFALTRVSTARAMGEREGGADVTYACRFAPPGFLREAVAAAGGVVSVDGSEEPPGAARSVDDIAEEAFRGLAARVAGREGGSLDPALLERLEDATLASPPRPDDDEGLYWGRILELSALCGELLRTKTGGRWTAAPDRDGLFPFAFTAGNGRFNVVDRAHRFLEQGESQRPGKLLVMAEDIGRGVDGPPMLNLKPADFPRGHGVCRPLLEAEGPTASRIPLVFVGRDQPNSFTYLPVGTPDAERHFDEARANLVKLDLPAVPREIGGVKVHVVSGDFYASEKILDRTFLRDVQRNLGAELLAAAVPHKGLLLLTDRVLPPEIAGFVALATVLNRETGGAPPLSPVVFLVRDGEVVGHLETESRPAPAKAAAPTSPGRPAPSPRPTPRPAKPGSLAAPVRRPPMKAGTPSLPGWVKPLGGILLLMSVYFGSRGCSRWQTSREARSASVEALTEVAGAETANALVDRHHGACFDEVYQTGWGRRQAAKFDEKAYVQCIVRAIERKDGAATRETRVRAPAPVSPRPLAPQRSPIPTPTPEPDYGLITLGDFEVTLFKPQPNVQLVFRFVAVGRTEALERAKSCMVDVQCGGQRIPGFREPTFTDCELEVDGPRARSDKAMSWGNTTPVQGECTLRFAVVRASRPQSNVIVVDLEETPAP